jgi:hypothetical protein
MHEDQYMHAFLFGFYSLIFSTHAAAKKCNLCSMGLISFNFAMRKKETRLMMTHDSNKGNICKKIFA